MSTPADWSAEHKVQQSEELAVESGCPDVMDDNLGDSRAVVKSEEDGKAENEIRELRGKVKQL